MTIDGEALARCAECGAEQRAGAECRACFEALLAFEAERPPVFGAVHHLTVAAYFLQHPIGYAPDILDAWHALLADALDGRATPRELMRRHGRQFAGSRRVRTAEATTPPHWPASWPSTVCSVLNPLEELPTPDVYIERARAWACETRATLDALRGTLVHQGAARAGQ